jgi:hypothetical protein
LVYSGFGLDRFLVYSGFGLCRFSVYSGFGLDRFLVYSGFGLDRFSVYSGFGLDRFSVYSGFGLDRFHRSFIHKCFDANYNQIVVFSHSIEKLHSKVSLKYESTVKQYLLNVSFKNVLKECLSQIFHSKYLNYIWINISK